MYIEKSKLESKSKKIPRKGRLWKIGTSIIAIVFAIALFSIMSVKTTEVQTSLKTTVIPTAKISQLSTLAPPPEIDTSSINIPDYSSYFTDFAATDRTADETTDESQPVSAQAIEWHVTAKSLIVKDFSQNELLFNNTMQDWRTHEGVDYGGNIGSSVFAVASGVVVNVYTDEEWGTCIEIEHTDGYNSFYASLQENPPVKKGENVRAGQVIGGFGRSASCEESDGPHLHFELLKNGERINPNSV